jgi:hypothetical protein
MTYVSCLTASLHDADTVFAAFDNHKKGDFTPYVLKSTDRGETWTSIAGDLPERDIVYSIQQDHVKPDLLFAGTEFGAYVTIDGGERWIRFKGGLPTIAVRDIDIQRRENDVVLGTFGRSIYILDDYTALRLVSEELLDRDAVLFPVKDALRYIEMSRLGGRSGRGSQGASFYSAPNPPYGAMFTYYLNEKPLTRKERRKEAEREAAKEDVTLPYPTPDELRAEDEERAPTMVLIVRDAAGDVVNRINAPRGSGIHRVAWNLRYPSTAPISVSSPSGRSPWWRSANGPLVVPGTYSVTLSQEVEGELTDLAGPVLFDVVPLELATFAAEDKEAVLEFQQRAARLHGAVQATMRVVSETQDRIAHVRQAIMQTPAADEAMLADVEALQQRLNDLLVTLRGDRSQARREEISLYALSQRAARAVYGTSNATSAPTQTHRDAYRYAAEELPGVLAELESLVEALAELERRLDAAGAPWTPGRWPNWRPE